MWKRGKLKYKEGGGGGPLYFDFSPLSEWHEVSLGSFQVANATLCTVHKDNYNLNHHRQRLGFINDLTLKIKARFVYNFGNIYWILTYFGILFVISKTEMNIARIINRSRISLKTSEPTIHVPIYSWITFMRCFCF